MIGYEEFKHQQNLESWCDRQASKADCAPEIRRIAFIAKVRRAFIYIDVQWIADHIQPWNVDEFKRQVADAHNRYVSSRNCEKKA